MSKRGASQIAESASEDDANEEHKESNEEHRESHSRHKAEDKDGRDKGSGSTSAEHSDGQVCQQGHPLTRGLANTRLACDSCGSAVKRGGEIFSCETCDFDQCERCVDGAPLLPEEDEGDGHGNNVHRGGCNGGGGGGVGGEDSGWGGGGGDAGGGSGGGGGRGRRQGRRGLSYAEPSEDDIYRRPRAVSYAEPGENDVHTGLASGRAKRVGREEPQSGSSGSSGSSSLC